MSEWDHSQNRPNSDFLKLLQKRLDKANRLKLLYDSKVNLQPLGRIN